MTDDDTATAGRHPNIGGSAGEPRRRGAVVGIIDNDPEIIETLSELLREDGFSPVGTVFGPVRGDRAFQEWLCRHSPDALVMDVPPSYALPWREVVNMCRIAAIGAVPTIVTATIEVPSREIVGLARGLRTLRKPYRLEELLDALCQMTRKPPCER